MKKIFSILVIFWSSFHVTTTLASESSLLPANYFGGYCSATTSDGVWVFIFGYDNQYYQCDLVRQALYNITAAPIQYLQHGTYRTNGQNFVSSRCYRTSSSFQGYGGNVLEAAYQYSVSTGDASCIFTVQ